MHKENIGSIHNTAGRIRTAADRNLDAIVLSIFFLSGFSSLMYEVVWQRLLTLHYGVGPVSVSLIVSAFMAGLGIGSLVGGFLSERIESRVFTYAAIELLIGCFGLISPVLLNYIAVYTAGSDYSLAFLCMFLFLITPTFLMGATLPFLTKIFNSHRQNIYATVSYLYFTNTIGGAAGALFSSYVAISFFGLTVTLYIAAGINLVLSLMILWMLPGSATRREAVEASIPSRPGFNPQQDEAAALGRTALVFAFISGFLAIGYEIAWFRVISILVKSSPYSFSTSLAVYLFGIAIGSYVISIYVRSKSTHSRRDFFFSNQVLIALSSASVFLLYYYLTEYTPFHALTRLSFLSELHPQFPVPPVNNPGEAALAFYRLFDVFIWPILLMFIPTFFIGGSFPVLSSLTSFDDSEEGKTVGTVYSFCILGNVMGGIITGFVLLPHVKTEKTLLLFSLVGILLGCFISPRSRYRIKRAHLAISALALFVLFPGNGDLYRAMHTPQLADDYEAHLEEGVDGITMTFRKEDTYITYINGLTHGSRPNPFFYFETLEAVRHAPRVGNILVIGYGQGSITEGLLAMPQVGSVTLVEINSTLLKNLKKMVFFETMLSHPKLRVVVDDCRRFLLNNTEKYDLILIDPLRTTEAYSNNLYSREFFETLESHLGNGGVLMVWMDEYKVMPKTIHSVFEYVRAYEWFCLASTSPLRPNESMAALYLENFSTSEREKILESRCDYLGDEDFVRRTTLSYPINTDLHPICEYYLGLRVKERLSMYREAF